MNKAASTESLYKQIERELVQDIFSGKYPPGSLLPSELELCEKYQVSRHTIRAALRELTDSKLVSRRKGIGTHVNDKNDVAEQSHSLATLEDLITLAKNNLRVVKRIDEVVADYELAKTIHCEPGSRWLHIASIREDSNKEGQPICWTDSYASPAYSKIRQLVRSDPFALISDLIEKHYGIKSVEVHQTITAIAVPKRIAKTLQVEPGTPALKVIRRYIDRMGVHFETTVSIHPAERYACSIVLKRQP